MSLLRSSLPAEFLKQNKKKKDYRAKSSEEREWCHWNEETKYMLVDKVHLVDF